MRGERPAVRGATEPTSLNAEIEELRLSNGLTIWLMPRGRLPLSTLRLVFPSGAARGPRHKSGLCELLVDLLRRGSRKRSATEIDSALAELGAELGTSVTDDSIRLALTVSSASLHRALRLVCDIVAEPTFPQRELVSYRKQARDGIEASLDDPEWVAGRAIFQAVFGAHPYAVPTEGYRGEVAGIVRRDLLAFQPQAIDARGAMLLVAGDLAPLVRRQLVAEASRLRAGPAARLPVPPVPALSDHRVLIVDKPDATQAQIRIACPGPPRNHPDFVAFLLGNGVLGGSFASRLVNEVRVNRGLTYGIGSRFLAMEAGGMFLIRSFTRLEKVAELVKVSFDEVERLKDSGPTVEELTRVRTYQRGAFLLGNETPEQLSGTLLDAFRYGLGPGWVARFPQLIEETPHEAVTAALRAHVLPSGYRIVAVGPAKSLQSSLRRFGRCKVVPLRSMA
jgi:zinc protease